MPTRSRTNLGKREVVFLNNVQVDLLVNPPIKGDPSYPLYKQEMDEIYESLKRRAKTLQEAFNDLQGVTCNPAQGSMYLFPQIRFSQTFLDAAKKAGKQPDEVYCLEMLNATGVVSFLKLTLVHGTRIRIYAETRDVAL